MKWLKRVLCSYKDIIILTASILTANLFVYLQNEWTNEPVKIAFLSVLLYGGLQYAFVHKDVFGDKRHLGGCIFWGIMFSLMMVVGQKIRTDSPAFQKFAGRDLILLLFYFGIGLLLFSDLCILTEDRRSRRFVWNGGENVKEPRHEMRRYWLCFSIILAVFWFPVFTAYYPGIVPDDATISIAMVLGDMPWDNHYPVFYSLIIGLFLLLGKSMGNMNLGIAMYSLVQMISMALLLGYVLAWLRGKGLKKIWVYSGIAYFSTIPLFGNYAIVMWKDPWFSGILILLGLFLYDHVVINRITFLEPRNLFIYAGMLVLESLLRNNGIYIAAVISIGLLIVYRKQAGKVLAAGIAAIALILFITGPVYKHVFSAENLFVESIGIPMQQMARVIVQDGKLTEEQKEFMDHLLPLEKYPEYYDPFLMDPIKWAPEFNTEYLDSHKGEFFKNWWGMLKGNLGIYVEQYLMITYGFWHVGGDRDHEFITTAIVYNDWGLAQSCLYENHLGYLMQDSLETKYGHLPSGLFVWILFFDAMLCWIRKRSVYLIPLLAMVGNWLTLMVATPTAFGMRYLYICMIGLPVLLVYPWLVLRADERE